MPDPASLVRATDIRLPPDSDHPQQAAPVLVLEDPAVRVTAMPVTHGHAAPAFAYRFDTAAGSVVFSGDTTVSRNLVALARNTDVLVHHVADLRYLAEHGFAGVALERMAELHTDVTEVGGVAERAGARHLILTHYLPAEPTAISEATWVSRAGQGFGGRTTAGQDGQQFVVDEKATE
jgi:ribonuclease BN (tRNA processing enzyme)